jgi:hypothetical protein
MWRRKTSLQTEIIDSSGRGAIMNVIFALYTFLFMGDLMENKQ